MLREGQISLGDFKNARSAELAQPALVPEKRRPPGALTESGAVWGPVGSGAGRLRHPARRAHREWRSLGGASDFSDSRSEVEPPSDSWDRSFRRFWK